MDIKPFVYESNFWADTSAGWIAAIIFAALFAVGFFIMKKYNYVLTILSFVGFLISVITVVCLPDSAEANAYEDYVSEAQEAVEADGFTIVSGTPKLKPNSQSALLLEYQNKNFDCTLFSPKDISKSIVFSCGEAKLTLQEIKEAK